MTNRQRGGSCTEKDRHSDRHSDRQLVERGAYTENDKQTEGRVMHGERQTQ